MALSPTPEITSRNGILEYLKEKRRIQSYTVKSPSNAELHNSSSGSDYESSIKGKDTFYLTRTQPAGTDQLALPIPNIIGVSYNANNHLVISVGG
jgi:hypothetical protein